MEENTNLLNAHDLDLAAQFIDEEYRRTWAEDFVDTTLAMQIAKLRMDRNWKQAELAKRAGTVQSAVSRMEDVNYGAHSIRVLKQLAAAFGLTLKVTFEEFGDLIRESADFTEAGLSRRSFEDDPYIGELLTAQGLALPQAPHAGVPMDDEPVAALDESARVYETFEAEFDAAVAGPTPDLVIHLKKWLMGYGLPNQDEPVYKRLYFSIPPDHRHGAMATRLAEACAELLLPDSFAELLSDPEDGEYAVVNLLRLSAMLAAGRDRIVASCGKLFPWLGGEWPTLRDRVKDAVIDLAVELGDLSLAENILGWPMEAGLSDRSTLALARWFLRQPISLPVAKSLAFSLVGNADDPLVEAASDQIIREFRGDEMVRNSREKFAEATTLINSEFRHLAANAGAY